MKVRFEREFLKCVQKINTRKVLTDIEDAINECKQVNSLTEIRNIKKLKGYKNAYRIKIGDYRIGFYFEEGNINFATVLNRKDIYRSFPK